MINLPSKKVLDEQKPEYALLPVDYYKLKVEKVELKMQDKYQSEEQEEVINVMFDVVSLKSGDKAFDIDGKEAKGRKVFGTFRTESIGFQQDGTPSKTRQLIAYATEQDVFEEINLSDWQDLVGKEVIAELVEHTSKKGVKSNKIEKFLKPLIKTGEEIPIINDLPKEEIDVQDIPY